MISSWSLYKHTMPCFPSAETVITCALYSCFCLRLGSELKIKFISNMKFYHLWFWYGVWLNSYCMVITGIRAKNPHENDIFVENIFWYLLLYTVIVIDGASLPTNIELSLYSSNRSHTTDFLRIYLNCLLLLLRLEVNNQ